MKGYKSATVAVMMMLPASAVLAPSSAAARVQNGRHGSHQAPVRVHRTRHLSFEARVVRSSAAGLTVRTPSGKILSFSASQIKQQGLHKRHGHRGRFGRNIARASDLQLSTGSVVINILGLQPGVLVQITETIDSDGTVTITITLPPSPGPESASGMVTEVDSDAFMLQSADGSELRLNMSADALSSLNLQACDTVDVGYHQDAGILIADTVNITGSSSSGDCAPTYDATGVIQDVSASSVTISGDQGQLTFSVDPSSGLTDGFQVGDLVDVTYTQNGDGSLSAADVQYVEEDATGTVTSVTTATNGGSLTITEDDTGQSDTFNADPNNGVQINAHAFNGVSVGDHVDVTYHQAAGQLVADVVSEQ